MIYLVEINYYNLNRQQEANLKLASKTYINPIDDSHYIDAIKQVNVFSNELILYGSSKANYGEIVIFNHDRQFDFLFKAITAGREVTIKYGDESQSESQFTILFKGLVERHTIQLNAISFTIRDNSLSLDFPLQTNKYLGNNVLPDGIEGDEQLKDKLKPLVFGNIKNFQPTLVNSAKFIYQVNDGFININQVYDRGVKLQQEADYSSLDDLNNNSPSAGCFRVLKSMGLIRLCTAPNGNITVDCNTYNTLAQNVIYDIFQRFNYTAIDTVSLLYVPNYEVGIVCDSNTVQSLITTICTSLGISFSFNYSNLISFYKLSDFNYNSFFNLDYYDEIKSDIEIETSCFSSNNIPIYKLTLKYDKNNTVQNDSELGGDKKSVNDPVGGLDRREWLKTDLRQIVIENKTLQNLYKISKDETIETVLILESNANTITNELFSILSAPIVKINLTIKIKLENLSYFEIGKYIQFSYRNLNASIFKIIKSDVDILKQTVNLSMFAFI